MALPLNEVVPNNSLIVGMRGTGKSYLASVFVEELAAHNSRVQSERDLVPAVVLATAGSWSGLRAGRTGGGRGGIRCLLIGGDRADFPLDATMGTRIADLADEIGTVPIVVQMDDLPTTDQQELVADFAERVATGRRHRFFHIVIDGAEELYPLAPRAGSEARCASAVECLVRRRRTQGIGVTMTVSRLARLHHNASSQAERFFLLRMWGSRDLEAVGDLFRFRPEPNARRTLMHRVRVLRDGEALHIAFGEHPDQRSFRIRRRRTYDSQRAPSFGVDKPPLPDLLPLPKGIQKQAKRILLPKV